MATKKKAVKKTAKKKAPKTFTNLEMEGAVWLIERNAKTNEIVKQDEIESEVVLKCLLHCIERGLQHENFEKALQKELTKA